MRCLMKKSKERIIKPTAAIIKLELDDANWRTARRPAELSMANLLSSYNSVILPLQLYISELD